MMYFLRGTKRSEQSVTKTIPKSLCYHYDFFVFFSTEEFEGEQQYEDYGELATFLKRETRTTLLAEEDLITLQGQSWMKMSLGAQSIEKKQDQV